MNHEKMWGKLEKYLEKKLDYYRNSSEIELAESMDGEKICLNIQKKMKKLEEKYNDDKR